MLFFSDEVILHVKGSDNHCIWTEFVFTTRDLLDTLKGKSEPRRQLGGIHYHSHYSGMGINLHYTAQIALTQELLTRDKYTRYLEPALPFAMVKRQSTF